MLLNISPAELQQLDARELGTVVECCRFHFVLDHRLTSGDRGLSGLSGGRQENADGGSGEEVGAFVRALLQRLTNLVATEHARVGSAIVEGDLKNLAGLAKTSGVGEAVEVGLLREMPSHAELYEAWRTGNPEESLFSGVVGSRGDGELLGQDHVTLLDSGLVCAFWEAARGLQEFLFNNCLLDARAAGEPTLTLAAAELTLAAALQTDVTTKLEDFLVLKGDVVKNLPTDLLADCLILLDGSFKRDLVRNDSFRRRLLALDLDLLPHKKVEQLAEVVYPKMLGLSLEGAGGSAEKNAKLAPWRCDSGSDQQFLWTVLGNLKRWNLAHFSPKVTYQLAMASVMSFPDIMEWLQKHDLEVSLLWQVVNGRRISDTDLSQIMMSLCLLDPLQTTARDVVSAQNLSEGGGKPEGMRVSEVKQRLFADAEVGSPPKSELEALLAARESRAEKAPLLRGEIFSEGSADSFDPARLAPIWDLLAQLTSDFTPGIERALRIAAKLDFVSLADEETKESSGLFTGLDAVGAGQREDFVAAREAVLRALRESAAFEMHGNALVVTAVRAPHTNPGSGMAAHEDNDDTSDTPSEQDAAGPAELEPLLRPLAIDLVPATTPIVVALTGAVNPHLRLKHRIWQAEGATPWVLATSDVLAREEQGELRAFVVGQLQQHASKAKRRRVVEEKMAADEEMRKVVAARQALRAAELKRDEDAEAAEREREEDQRLQRRQQREEDEQTSVFEFHQGVSDGDAVVFGEPERKPAEASLSVEDAEKLRRKFLFVKRKRDWAAFCQTAKRRWDLDFPQSMGTAGEEDQEQYEVVVPSNEEPTVGRVAAAKNTQQRRSEHTTTATVGRVANKTEVAVSEVRATTATVGRVANKTEVAISEVRARRITEPSVTVGRVAGIDGTSVGRQRHTPFDADATNSSVNSASQRDPLWQLGFSPRHINELRDVCPSEIRVKIVADHVRAVEHGEIGSDEKSRGLKVWEAMRKAQGEWVTSTQRSLMAEAEVPDDVVQDFETMGWHGRVRGLLLFREDVEFRRQWNVLPSSKRHGYAFAPASLRESRLQASFHNYVEAIDKMCGKEALSHSCTRAVQDALEELREFPDFERRHLAIKRIHQKLRTKGAQAFNSDPRHEYHPRRRIRVVRHSRVH